MLKGKTVLLGVTGSIAAYKTANIARMLKKLNCNVHVLMTKNAENFINPITFETLTQNKCLIDTFDRSFQYSVEHVALAKQADLVVIAPASANIIGKIANGIADDMLTTTVMACTCKKIISPAMNHNMFHNPIVQDNIKRLKSFGYDIIEPERGMLANGDTGDGKMPSEEVIVQHIIREIAFEKDFIGKKILVTAGATAEPIDPVRFITNHSTGKMGAAVASVAVRRGAEVTFIAGKMQVSVPMFVKSISVTTAHEMFEAVKNEYQNADIIIKTAAVADYTPENVSCEKIKKNDGGLVLSLKRTDDIIGYIGSHKRNNQILCGFSMETENMLENSKSKLERKNLDIIAANSLRTKGAGFGTDTNVLTLITKNSVIPLEIMSKEDAANRLLDVIKQISDTYASKNLH